MKVSKRLLFGLIACAHFAAVAAPNQRVDFEINDGPVNSCHQPFAEVKESQLVATSPENTQASPVNGSMEKASSYNHFPRTLAYLANEYNGRNLATRLNIANETELPDAYRIIAHMLNAGILKLNQKDSRSELTIAWMTSQQYLAIAKNVKSEQELADLQKGFAKRLKVTIPKFKEYVRQIKNIKFSEPTYKQAADVLWVYDDVLRFDVSDVRKQYLLFFTIVNFLVLFPMITFYQNANGVNISEPLAFFGPVLSLLATSYLLAEGATKYQELAPTKFKMIFRTELNQALTRERLQATDSDILPLSAELKSLPGETQEQMLEDYETVADVAQLSRRFAERAKRQLELTSETSKPAPEEGKVAELLHSKLSKIMLANTELMAAHVEADSAMRLFLTFNQLPPGTKMCHPGLTCFKFNTILSSLIDPTVDIKTRVTNISKALNLSRYLVSKLSEAIEQHADLSEASHKLISEAESQITKIRVTEETRKELENLHSRITIMKNSLNEYEKMGLKLKEYLRNAKVFEAQLLELRKNPNAHLENSLRIDSSR